VEGTEADPARALLAQVGVRTDDLDDVRRLADPVDALWREAGDALDGTAPGGAASDSPRPNS
jgi:hypothetical protein